MSSIDKERERETDKDKDKDKEKIATCRINRETYVLRVKTNMFSAINRKKFDELSIAWFPTNMSI